MKFFHTADIHFGVENYGRIDPQTGIHTRLLDFSKNLGLIVKAAIEQQIDFFLFCGDAYKTAHPTPTQQKLLAQHMIALQKAGIPVVIVVGNHDHPLSFGKAHALDVFSYLPVDGFYVFSKPELITIPTKSGPVQIVGIPWPMRNHVVAHQANRFKTNTELADHISVRIGQLVEAFAAQLDHKVPAVLAGHLTVSSGVFSGSEKCAVYGTDPIFLPSQLALNGFDYVALGHLHRYQNLNPSGIPVVYAGSIERVDFGERKEEKGYCSVTIDCASEPKKTTHTFHTLPTRRMLQFDIHLRPEEDQTQQIIEALGQEDLTDAIVKIIYHIPEGKTDRVDLASVQRACVHAMYVVGVFPVHAVVQRERRAALKIDMDFTTLLTRYFESKESLSQRKASLIKKAYDLKHAQNEGTAE